MKEPRKIIIVGAGSQGSIVADILEARGTRAVGFVDDTSTFVGREILGVPVLGTVDRLAEFDHDAVVVAVGDNAARRQLTERLVQSGERFATAIHPFSSIAASARIGEGSMISAGALILPNAVVGRGVLINTKASIDHDTIVGDFVHVSAGCTVGARSRIGDDTLISLGASVTSGRSIGARVTIGAGAVVLHDFSDDVTAWGVPARIVQRA